MFPPLAVNCGKFKLPLPEEQGKMVLSLRFRLTLISTCSAVVDGFWMNWDLATLLQWEVLNAALSWVLQIKITAGTLVTKYFTSVLRPLENFMPLHETAQSIPGLGSFDIKEFFLFSRSPRTVSVVGGELWTELGGCSGLLCRSKALDALRALFSAGLKDTK